jgi:hypothetical protein
MPRCFSIQPFDGGKFDKRFDEVYKPAIVAAGLEPYRVDRDPGVSIPIDTIEQGIRDSIICLADVTEDNPNVWFELGYAIACNKEVVLVCSNERTTKFPFDIQHRTIIRYGTGSPSDFQNLSRQITEKIAAYLKKLESLEKSVTEIKKVTSSDGLSQHEMVALATIVADIKHPDDTCSVVWIKRDMETNGYTYLAASIAIKSLAKKGLVSVETVSDARIEEEYAGCKITESGWEWVLENQLKFNLVKPPKPKRSSPSGPQLPSSGDSDIPF